MNTINSPTLHGSEHLDKHDLSIEFTVCYSFDQIWSWANILLGGVRLFARIANADTEICGRACNL